MIFELSRAFENLHSADAWEPYLPAVENLINAHVSGDHYILPTRSIAEQLLTFDFFSRRQRAVLEHDILAKFSTLVAGARGAAVTIYLTRDGEFSTGIRPNQRAMPLKLFVDTELCARTRVLVENSARDGAFWLAIVQTLATDVNVTTIPRIDFEMGGGSAIGDVYRQKIEQRNPTLCLVDSDRDFPGGPLGETARRVEDLRGTEAVPTARAYILGVREVENFIPVEVLADIYSRNPAVQARLETFQRLESVSKDPHCAPGTEYNRFVDMKHGLRRSIIRRHEAIAGDFFSSALESRDSAGDGV